MKTYLKSWSQDSPVSECWQLALTVATVRMSELSQPLGMQRDCGANGISKPPQLQ
jgi:hypothetical protein